MTLYIVQDLQYEPDHIHVKEILEETEYSDLLDAYKKFASLDNAILIEKTGNSSFQIAKSSRGFSKEQMKQFYLDEACDILGMHHLLYSSLCIDEITDMGFDHLIERILTEELNPRAGSVRGPIVNELVHHLIERR